MRQEIDKKETHVVSFILFPITALWGAYLSSIHIKLIFLFGICIFTYIITALLKKKTVSRFLFHPMSALLGYAIILYALVPSNPDSTRSIATLGISFFFVYSFFAFGKNDGATKWSILIYSYLLIMLCICYAEIRFGLVLPMSAKASSVQLAAQFKGLPTGLFYNPNDFSTAIVLLFAYEYTYLTMLKNNRRFIVLLIALFLTVVSGSRGALLVFVFFPFFLAAIKSKNILRWTIAGIIVFITIILIIPLLWPYLSGLFRAPQTARFYQKVGNLFSSGGDSSIKIRINLIQYSLRHLNELILGQGPGGVHSFLANAGVEGGGIVDAHNFFLEILICYGIPGLIITFQIFMSALVKSWKISITGVSPVSRACGAGAFISFLAFFIVCVVPSSLLKDWFFGWFPVSMSMLAYGVDLRERKLGHESIHCHC